jgi:cytochrome c556
MKSSIALVLLVACVAGAAACSSAPPPPPFKPVADTKLLMQAMIDPTADEIWDAVRTIVTDKGSEEIRPHTNAEWDAVRNHAVTLAEAGNLLMMVPRAKDGGEWMKRAQEMIDTSEKAIRAAEAKNADQLFTVGGEIYDSCSNCHQKYMDAIVNANK